MTRKATFRTGGACILAGLAGQAHGQCTALSKLEPGDPQASAQAGYSVAIDTGYVLVGAPGQSSAGFASGEVSTYRTVFGNWGFDSYIKPTDPSPTAQFGTSVGLGGSHTWCIVGAPGAANNAGAAYFFQLVFNPNTNVNSWVQSYKSAVPFSSGDHLGSAVAINSQGTLAVASAPSRTMIGVTSEGVIEVFARSGSAWSDEGTLFQGDLNLRHAGDLYGYSVAADGQRVVVGVPMGDPAGKADSGYAQVWTRDAASMWSASEVIAPADLQPGDHFGRSVSLQETYHNLLIGAPNATAGGYAGNGAVYVFHYAQGFGWVLQQKLIAHDGAPGLNFGTSVAMGNGEIIVGTGDSTQRTYVFRDTGLGRYQDARYLNPSGIAGESFGSAVAIDRAAFNTNTGTDFVAGAWGCARGNMSLAGAAYAARTPTPADGTDTYAAARSVEKGTYTGCTERCSVDGSATCGNGALQGPDVWYDYHANANETLVIDTQGSTLDTVLSVHSAYDNAGTAANTLDCNDDFAPPQRWSRITLPVSGGLDYVIRVAGYGSATGAYTLNIHSAGCYANCDQSSAAPVLNVADFTCFLQKYAAADPYANCDASTTPPTLNVLDFTCFLQKFAAGCP